MKRCVLGVRCVFMAVAMLLALPLSGDVFEVRGGSSGDGGECDTVKLGPTDCVANSGGDCSGTKQQCKDCQIGYRERKESKCNIDGGSSACGDMGCVAGQKDSVLSGEGCIGQTCPGDDVPPT